MSKLPVQRDKSSTLVIAHLEVYSLARQSRQSSNDPVNQVSALIPLAEGSTPNLSSLGYGTWLLRFVSSCKGRSAGLRNIISLSRLFFINCLPLLLFLLELLSVGRIVIIIVSMSEDLFNFLYRMMRLPLLLLWYM
jgi:hypothetical protein